jgi:hypothetical protein
MLGALTLLCGLIELTIRFEIKVYINEVGSSKELPFISIYFGREGSLGEKIAYLKHHPGRNDWCNTQFHQRAPVTGQHHSQPI